MSKSKRRRWRYKGDRFTERRFRPYVLAIGQVALAWNDLHEELAMLFVTMNGGGWIEPHLGIWNSASMDRARRAMIRGLNANYTAREKAEFPRRQPEINWLLAEAEKLENDRNNIIHSPLFLVRGGGIAAGYTGQAALPHTLGRNIRALNLSEKRDLLSYFRGCRNAALMLRDFTHHLKRAISASGAPWPRRPVLPDREQKTGHPDRHPRSGPKSPPRPPQSSRV